MEHQKQINKQKIRRRFRVRNALRTNLERPRLNVARSHRHIYAQIIDDFAGKTIVAASTMDKNLSKKVKYGGNKAAAELVGKTLAERAVAAGIKEVRFDRGQYKYHGRVAALADAARAGGLAF